MKVYTLKSIGPGQGEGFGSFEGSGKFGVLGVYSWGEFEDLGFARAQGFFKLRVKT